MQLPLAGNCILTYDSLIKMLLLWHKDNMKKGETYKLNTF